MNNCRKVKKTISVLSVSIETAAKNTNVSFLTSIDVTGLVETAK